MSDPNVENLTVQIVSLQAQLAWADASILHLVQPWSCSTARSISLRQPIQPRLPTRCTSCSSRSGRAAPDRLRCCLPHRHRSHHRGAATSAATLAPEPPARSLRCSDAGDVAHRGRIEVLTSRPGGPGPKPKMAYRFTVLEDLINQTQAATGTTDT